MKSFNAFRLDTANHILWREEDRLPIAPKSFDVLAYLVKHAGRVVTQDEILEALWPETYVNPEVLRKYILEVRKTLGDRAESPEFIETLPKRGYRFVALVTDERTAEPPDLPTLKAVEETVGPAKAPSKEHSSGKRRLWKLAVLPALAVVVAAAIAGQDFPGGRIRANSPSLKATAIA